MPCSWPTAPWARCCSRPPASQRCFEELNLSQPEAVFRVHQAYIEAGAQIIETNTFGANRSKLAPLGLAEQVAAINHRGVKIAREAREAARTRC